jgi:DNA-3-methyladenine glycosylase II
MGNWTASIISLFYIGHEDVFPSADGSLRRAMAILDRTKRGKRKKPFDPDRAAPYRSYLALYLWHALDSGLLKQK